MKKMKMVLCQLAMILLSQKCLATSISESGMYVKYCGIAAQDEKEFAKFKSNPMYRCILEHATKEQGQAYLDTIRFLYPKLLEKMACFKANDQVGKPVVYDYPEVGAFSPTTLQYIKIAGDLSAYFGDMSHFHIVEIGGGYGGQAAILHLDQGFEKYTLIDLPQSLALAKRYMETFNIGPVEFVPNEPVYSNPTYDLLISNYAFSEISYPEQIEYLQKIITQVPRGYMTINFISKLFNIETMQLEEMAKALSTSGHDVYMTPEWPPTGDHNMVIIWKPKES